MIRRVVGSAALAALVLLSGCMRVTLLGHTVTEGRAAPPAPPPAAAAPGAQATPGAVAAVSVASRLQADPRPLGGERFALPTLRRVLESVWQERRLLDTQLAMTTAEVVVTRLELERTSPAGVFGQIAATGRLAGTVRVLDATGTALRSFDVRAEAPLSIAQEGDAPDALDGLYRQFAEAAAALLVRSADS